MHNKSACANVLVCIMYIDCNRHLFVEQNLDFSKVEDIQSLINTLPWRGN